MKKWKVVPPPFRKFKKIIFENLGRTGQFIYQIGETPLLREPSKVVPIDTINSYDMKRKLDLLKKSLLKYRKITGVGRGITAVQIGIPERFSIVYTPKKLLYIINPKITKKSEKLLRYPEICMSSAPIVVPTVRPAWIEFEYYNEKGEFQEWNIKDDTVQGKILNRVFQHEIDHMDGILCLDKNKDPRELFLESDPRFYDKVEFEDV
jgi:peptide deformylase